MICAAYVRYSSEGQRDGYSIEAQLNAIKNYCEREGYTLSFTYADEARSGTIDDRAEFQQMITDAKAKKFECLIVHKFDRFARNKYDATIYKKVLRDAGVRIISVLEPLDNSPEAGIMEALYDALAEYYSKNLSRETLKGKNEAAKRCQFLGGGYVTYGYAVENKKYVIIPEEAKIIQEIFSRVASGESYGSVSRSLYDRGVRNRQGRIISSTSISRMLDNPMYKGTYIFGLRSRDKTKTPITIEDGCPAIVSKELFEQASSIKKKHQEEWWTHTREVRAREKETTYLLTGYIFCGVCGSNYYGHKSKSTGHNRKGERIYKYEYHSYRCSKRHLKTEACTVRDYKKICDNVFLRKEPLEDYTIELIERCISSDSIIDSIVTLLKDARKRQSEQLFDVKSIKKSIQKLEGQEDKLLDAYISGLISKEKYEERLKDCRTKKASLNQELARVEAAQSNKPLPTTKQIKSTFLKALKGDKSDIEYRKMLISTFLESIIVYPDRLEFTFKFPIFNGSYSSSVGSDIFVRSNTTVSTIVLLRTKVSMSDFKSNIIENIDFTFTIA